jgi:hypothetical protein
MGLTHLCCCLNRQRLMHSGVDAAEEAEMAATSAYPGLVWSDGQHRNLHRRVDNFCYPRGVVVLASFPVVVCSHKRVSQPCARRRRPVGCIGPKWGHSPNAANCAVPAACKDCPTRPGRGFRGRREPITPPGVTRIFSIQY